MELIRVNVEITWGYPVSFVCQCNCTEYWGET